MSLLSRVRQKHITLMQKTIDTLNHLTTDLSAEQVVVWRDGADGWSILQVLCHLRDFDVIFYNRVQSILMEEEPLLTAYDHLAMAQSGNYNQQNPKQVMTELTASRAKFIDLFKSLTDEQWERTGIHPEAGQITLTDSVMQVGHHDSDHIEQITRILRDNR